MGAATIEHVNARPHPLYDEESVRLMAERGVASVFTSVVSLAYEITQAFPERLDDQRLRSDLPPDIYADVRASIQHPERLRYFAEKREISRWHPQKLRQLYDGGVRIMVGTDSGTPMNFHYESTCQEMDLLVQYGMPPMKVISGATRLPPELYGLEDELGTIEPGKLADIIVVDGNPLQDMKALKHVVHVIKDGEVIR
jgi:imidazolonepropionase-like amidohydrolase